MLTLFVERDDGGWEWLGTANGASMSFSRRLDVLKAVAKSRGVLEKPALIWLPPDQILSGKDLPIKATDDELLSLIATQHNHKPSILCLDLPPDDAKTAPPPRYATFKHSVVEARDFAARWGFVPGCVSTRKHPAGLSATPPVFWKAKPITSRGVGAMLAPAVGAICVALGVAFAASQQFGIVPPSDVSPTVPVAWGTPIEARGAAPAFAVNDRLDQPPQRRRLPATSGLRDALSNVVLAWGRTVSPIAPPRVAALSAASAPRETSADVALTGVPAETDRAEYAQTGPHQSDLPAPLRSLDVNDQAFPGVPPVAAAAHIDAPSFMAAIWDRVPLRRISISHRFARPAPAALEPRSLAPRPVLERGTRDPVAPLELAAHPLVTQVSLAKSSQSEQVSAIGGRMDPERLSSTLRTRSQSGNGMDGSDAFTRHVVKSVPSKIAGLSLSERFGLGAVGPMRTAATQKGLELSAMTLIGVIGVPEKLQALVRLPNGRFRTVSAGDALEGWSVVDIEPEALQLGRQGEHRQLPLATR